MANLEQNLRPLLDPDPDAWARGGDERARRRRTCSSATATAARRRRATYAPDPTSANPTAPVTLSYSAFHPETSPLEDLVYALGVMMSDPVMDDLLQLGRQLMAQHPADARAAGRPRAARSRRSPTRTPRRTSRRASTLWDELLDVIAQIAHNKDGIGAGGVLEDLFLAFAQDTTVPLQQTFASLHPVQATRSTYNHNSTSGGLDRTRSTVRRVEPVVERHRAAARAGRPHAAGRRATTRARSSASCSCSTTRNGLDVCTKAGRGGARAVQPRRRLGTRRLRLPDRTR